jgi:hypothetical protein
MKLKIQLLENDYWYDLINLDPVQFRTGIGVPIKFDSVKQAVSVFDQLVKDGIKPDELRYIACQNPSSRPRIYPDKYRDAMVSLSVPRDVKESVRDVAIALAWGEYDDAIALLTKLKEIERAQILTE